jgi:hypothetical protein
MEPPVTSPNNKPSMTTRHDAVIDRLNKALTKAGYSARVNSCFEGSLQRPDLLINSIELPVIIDVTIPFDEPENLQVAHDEKVRKYYPLATTLPFVDGSLGSWLTTNDVIAFTIFFPWFTRWEKWEKRVWKIGENMGKLGKIWGNMEIWKSLENLENLGKLGKNWEKL